MSNLLGGYRLKSIAPRVPKAGRRVEALSDTRRVRDFPAQRLRMEALHDDTTLGIEEADDEPVKLVARVAVDAAARGNRDRLRPV